MQYYWLMLNRTFEVFVTRSMILAVPGYAEQSLLQKVRNRNNMILNNTSMRGYGDGTTPSTWKLQRSWRWTARTFNLREAGLARSSSFRENGVWVLSRILGDSFSRTYQAANAKLKLLGTQDAGFIAARLQEARRLTITSVHRSNAAKPTLMTVGLGSTPEAQLIPAVVGHLRSGKDRADHLASTVN